LQRFQRSNVPGDIIVLMSDPFGDPDGAIGGPQLPLQYQTGLVIAARAAIYVGH
jgi:hypothetical protein